MHQSESPSTSCFLRRPSAKTFPRGILTVAAAFLFAVASSSSADAAPANNNFSNAIVLPSVANTSGTGNNLGANLEGGEPNPLGIGGKSVWWRWQAPASGRVAIDTFGSGIDSVLYVFTGTAVGSLTTVAMGDHADGDDKARVYFTATSGVIYRIAVHGFEGDEGSISLNIVSPAIAAPANDNFANRIPLTPGSYPFQRTGDSTAGATVEYLANEPLALKNIDASVWYSWTAPSTTQYVIDTYDSDFDTVLQVFTGTNLGTLSVVEVDDDSDGDAQSRVILNATGGVTYQIAVLGYRGETGSIDLDITIPSPALVSPANDNFANHINLGSTFPTANFIADSANATIEPLETYPLELGGASVWWKWTAPGGLPEYIKISTLSSNFDTVLYVFTGSALGGLSLVASSDDAEGGFQSLVNINPNSGQVYYIAVHGWKGDTGLASLAIDPGVKPPDYNNFANEKDLGKHRSVTKIFNSGSTRGNLGCDIEPGEFSLLQSSPTFAPFGGTPGGASAWFRFTADITANYTIDTFGSNFDTILLVYEVEDDMEDLVEIVANDNTGGLQSEVTFAAVKDQKYLLAINGVLGETGDNITINIDSGATAPSNDEFAGQFTMPGTLADTVTGTNVAATVQVLGEPLPNPPTTEDPEGIGGASVWWKWTAPVGADWVEFNTFGSTFDTVLYVFQGAFYGGLSPKGYSDEAAGASQSRVNLQVIPGQVYRLCVQGYFGDTGDITLRARPGTPAPANDNFASPDTSLGSLATASDTGTNLGASVEPMEPDPLHDGGASVWWTWTAPSSGWVEVNTIGSNFDTLLYVFTGGTLSTLTNLAADDGSGGGNASRLNFIATMGTTYRFAVHGNQGLTGNISIQVKPGLPPPTNDDFADRPFLGSGATASLSGSSSGASNEASEPPNSLGGAASVWWSWQAPVNGWVQMDTFGSAFDTVLFVYTGNSISALNTIAKSDNSQNTLQSRVNFLAIAGTTYHIALNGYQGATGAFNLNIAPGFVPPNHDNFSQRIDLGKSKPSTVPPKSWTGTNAGSSLEPGEPDSLEIGGASLWFKWTADEDATYQVNTFGSNIDTVLYLYSDDDDPLLITELGFNEDAQGTNQSRIDFFALKDAKFRIAVHGKNDSWGTIKVEVKGGTPAPANNNFANAIDLGMPSSTTAVGSNAGASLEHGEPDPLGDGAKSVWWKWTAPTSGWYEIDTLGSGIDTLLYISTGDVVPVVTNLALVDGNDDDTAAIPQSRASFQAVVGTNYYISVMGIKGATGAITLNINSVLDPPANDDFTNVNNLGGTLGVTDTIGNAGATIEIFEPDSEDEGGRSVWWCFTPSSSGWIKADTHGSLATSGRALDTILYVYTGSTFSTLAERGFNDSGDGQDTSAVNFFGTAGQTYHLAVHGDDGEIGSVTINVNAGVPAPGNDNVASATLPMYDLLNALPTSTTGSNAGASLQHGEPDSDSDGGASVWWTWTAPAAPATQWIQVDTFGSSFDTLLYVFSGTNFANFVEEGFNTEAAGTFQSAVNFLATANTTYHIAVHGDDAFTGSINLAISAGTPPPPNDDFANAIALAAAVGASDTGTNVGAKLETGEPDPLSDGGASVWWSWTPSSSGYVQANTFGSAYDTILYVFKAKPTAVDPFNPTLAELLTIGFNDEAAGTLLSRVNFQATAGVKYFFAVHGDKGATGATSINVAAGVSPPSNDNHATPVDLGGAPTGFASGSSEGATLEVDEKTLLLNTSPTFAPYSGPGGASVWYTWTAPSSDEVIVDTIGSDFDTIIYIYTGTTISNFTEVIANDDEDSPGSIFTSRVTFIPNATTTYHIAVHGSDGDTGTVNLTVSPLLSLSPYQAWLTQYPSLTGPDALATADPDKDGIINLSELPFGLNPTIDSSLGGSDPNASNQPQFVQVGNMLQILYTLVPANLTVPGFSDITVGGAVSVDLFQTSSPVIPFNISGNDYRVETMITAPGTPTKQLRVIVTDPN